MHGMRDLLRRDLRILAYHRVLESHAPEGFEFDPELISADAEGFRRQMALVKRRFNPTSFEAVLECLDRGLPLPENAVLVTFDDGYDDNFRVAYPILRDLGMSAMFFVSTGHIDSGMPYAYDWLAHMVYRTNAHELESPELGRSWRLPDSTEARQEVVKELLDAMKSRTVATQKSLLARLQREWDMPPMPHPHCRPMTWEQLREMRAGGMEIGSHGVNHLTLSQLPAADMEAEVRDSKLRLEQELGVAIKVMSYPVGGLTAFDGNVMDTVRASGYALACSYMSGTSTGGGASRYAMRRIPVERDMDLPWFEAVMAVPEVFSYPARVLAS